MLLRMYAHKHTASRDLDRDKQYGKIQYGRNYKRRQGITWKQLQEKNKGWYDRQELQEIKKRMI